MDDIARRVGEIFEQGPRRLILSRPAKDAEYVKIDVRPLGSGYQAQMLTATQAFHKNMSSPEARTWILGLLETRYRQLNAWTDTREYQLRMTKKGRALATGRAAGPPVSVSARHDREKRYLLEPGGVVPPLVDMGVMTADGMVVGGKQRKFRQINRFLEIIDDEIRRTAPAEPLRILDFGCGKSYLTFIVYHYLTNIRGMSVRMTGLDLKRDVVEKCRRAAEKYGYDGLVFETGDIGAYRGGEPPDMVITLHACDTATDDALFQAVTGGANMIFTAPCCHHELGRQIRSDEFPILTRYGVVRERMAALMTDAIRANLLACCGYKTQLMEFVEFEHTPKNLLIRAVKTDRAGSDAPLREVEAIMAAFHLEPTLYRLLRQAGRIGTSG